jgi:hypothetical protein
MNCADNIAAMNAGGLAPRETSATSLHAVLRSIYSTVRKFCPTWEEWQTAVELHPVAGQEPDPM